MNKIKKISTYSRAPCSLQVVFNPKLEDLNCYVDWSSWYITNNQDSKKRYEQTINVRVLLSSLYELAEEQSWHNVFIGTDKFFSWVPEHPMVRVSPDVFLLDQPPKPLPTSWKMWLPGHRPPRLAFEFIKKSKWREQYQNVPSKYVQLGTKELVMFDPKAITKKTKNRFPLQIFRRTVDNIFNRIYYGSGPARCEELDAWLVVMVDENQQANLRISRNAEGTDLVPISEEI